MILFRVTFKDGTSALYTLSSWRGLMHKQNIKSIKLEISL